MHGGTVGILRNRCIDWLEKNFGLEASIDSVKIIKSTEIDILLNQVGIEFTFTTHDGTKGDSVAFFKQDDLNIGTQDLKIPVESVIGETEIFVD